jgi:hypothetical protein
MGQIYGLVDPRNGKIVYVGAGLAEDRAASHNRRPHNKAMIDLLDELDGEELKVVVLEDNCGRDIYKRETEWIKKLIAEGVDLLNVVGTQKQREETYKAILNVAVRRDHNDYIKRLISDTGLHKSVIMEKIIDFYINASDEEKTSIDYGVNEFVDRGLHERMERMEGMMNKMKDKIEDMRYSASSTNNIIRKIEKALSE